MVSPDGGFDRALQAVCVIVAPALAVVVVPHPTTAVIPGRIIPKAHLNFVECLWRFTRNHGVTGEKCAEVR
jgi:hypothetical protein